MRFPSEMRFEPAAPRRARRRMIIAATLGLLSCSAVMATWSGRGTSQLELDEAIEVLQRASTPISRCELAELAIFRIAERSLEALREAAKRDDAAGLAARHYLEQLRAR